MKNIGNERIEYWKVLLGVESFKKYKLEIYFKIMSSC